MDLGEPAQSVESPRTLLLRVERISKSFPGVLALQDVSLEVHPGEVLGLVGENGAGKSTLMKILSGVYEPDAGEIVFAGKPVTLHSPRQAQDLGISIIYQEFNLMSNLSVEENVFVGREPNSSGVVRWRALRQQTEVLLGQLGVHLDPGAAVRDLSVAEQQMVEIAKALSLNAAPRHHGRAHVCLDRNRGCGPLHHHRRAESAGAGRHLHLAPAG